MITGINKPNQRAVIIGKIMKNFSRISNILGTWTSTTHLKADIGSYELMAYFVIHFMPDPMSAYRCALDLCDELENDVCVMSGSNDADSSTNMENKCQRMQDSVVEWSDGTITRFVGPNVEQSQSQVLNFILLIYTVVVAFMYFGGTFTSIKLHVWVSLI
jgi:hypothetical protein